MNYAVSLDTACALLRESFLTALNNDPILQALIPSQEAIVLGSPGEIQPGPSAQLSIWLYQVTVDESTRNRTPVGRGIPRVEGAPTGTMLELWFLITPFARNASENIRLLGAVMQILMERPVIPYMRHDINQSGELRVYPVELPLADHLHLWEALQMPFRLSRIYRVQLSPA